MGNNKIINYIKKLRNIKREYLFLGVPLLGIMIFIIAFLAFSNLSKKDDVSFDPQKTVDVNKTTETQNFGTLAVDSKIKGAQFLLNSTVYYTPTTIKLAPGSYDLAVHNSGYKDESYTVTVANSKTTKITFKMEEQSIEESIDSEELQWEEAFKSQAEDEKQVIAARETKYPLTKYLPQVIGTIMLDYEVSPDGYVQYIVHALPNKTYSRSDYQQSVDNFIRSKGFNPQLIQVQWK